MLDHQRRITTVESVEAKRMVEKARMIAREVEEEELSRKLKEHESKNAQE